VGCYDIVQIIGAVGRNKEFIVGAFKDLKHEIVLNLIDKMNHLASQPVA
jgi:hypothetical protein